MIHTLAEETIQGTNLLGGSNLGFTLTLGEPEIAQENFQKPSVFQYSFFTPEPLPCLHLSESTGVLTFTDYVTWCRQREKITDKGN